MHPHQYLVYVTLPKYFSHPSLVIYLFCATSHIKLTNWQTGTANFVGTTNSKPPGPIIMFDQSETWSSSQNRFITLFRCTALMRLLAASAYWAHMQEQNHFPELNRHILAFLHLILMCMVTYWAAVGILLRVRFHVFFILPLSNPN